MDRWTTYNGAWASVGQVDGALRGFAFEQGRAGQRVVARRGLALGQGGLDQALDDRPVLGVHAAERTQRPGGAQGA